MTALDGRRALVTGASSGIGAATASRLMAAGAEVHVVARRRDKLIETVGREAVDAGRAVVHVADLARPGQCDAVVDAFAPHQGDILVLAAGTNVTLRASLDLTDEGWDEILRLNLDAAAHMVRRSLPGLVDGGDIVLISSVSGAYPDASGPAYQASKAGLIAFGRAVSRELHGRGVRVTNVLPGIVDTPLLDRRPTPPDEATRAWALQPDDVAAAVEAAVSLPPRACMAEVTVLATRLQALGAT